MSLSKKIFIFSSSFFILLILLWGIYFLSFREPSKQKESSVEISTPIQKTETTKKTSKLSVVSEEAVLSPVLIKDNSALKYYSKENGFIYQIEFDGSNKIALSEKELFGLTDVSWSPSQDKVINNFYADGRNSFFYYNHTERSGYSLKNNLDTVVWQNNEKILYKHYEPSSQKRSLNIANPDGSDWIELTNLDSPKIKIAPVPMTGLISFWNQGNGFEETLLQTIPALGGDKKILFSGSFGTDYLWSPDGNQILISHLTERESSNIQLAITNAKGGEYKNLNIPTIVSKCAWSTTENVIYYALPGMIPENTVMPNDYFAGQFKTADTFWKVDIKTGEAIRLINLDEFKEFSSIDAIDLFLNEDESMLFFTNRTDGKLYSLTL